jgi:hypothetical protein
MFMPLPVGYHLTIKMAATLTVPVKSSKLLLAIAKTVVLGF